MGTLTDKCVSIRLSQRRLELQSCEPFCSASKNLIEEYSETWMNSLKLSQRPRTIFAKMYRGVLACWRGVKIAK